jgi:hypothetical protein
MRGIYFQTSFFGVRAGVIEQPKLGDVGLHSKIQSVPVSEVIFLFLGLYCFTSVLVRGFIVLATLHP